jgi:hypothetical protein
LQTPALRWTPYLVNHKLPLIQLFRESGLHDQDSDDFRDVAVTAEELSQSIEWLGETYAGCFLAC